MTTLNNSCKEIGAQLKSSIEDNRTSWGYVTSDKGHIGGRGICFASVLLHNFSFQTSPEGWQRFISYCFGGMERNLRRCKTSKQEEIFEDYLNWLFKESSWKYAFITKSANSARKWGVWSGTNHHPRYILQAHMLARHPTFCPLRVNAWYHLKSYMDPHLALFASALYTADTDGKLKYSTTTNEHMGLMNDGPPDMLKAIYTLRTRPAYPIGQGLSINRDYRGLNKFWSPIVGTGSSRFKIPPTSLQTLERVNTLGTRYIVSCFPANLVGAELESRLKKWMKI